MPLLIISIGEQRNSEGTDEKAANGSERYVETFLSLLSHANFRPRRFLSGRLILERPGHCDRVPLELKHRIYSVSRIRLPDRMRTL